jgi:hypothetical protein
MEDQVRRGGAALLFVLSGVVSAYAGPANQYVSGCQKAAALDAAKDFKGTPHDAAAINVCAGAIDTLLTVGPALSDPWRFCLPADGTTVRQAEVIVSKYMQEHPEQSNELFAGVAAHALREAWGSDCY